MAEYHDYGFYNESPAHTFFYLQQPLLNLLSKEKNQCILDLGCGNGYFASLLISLGHNAYGTDASEQGIAIAKKQNPDRFYLQDLSTGKLPAPLQALKFDTIISTEVIEHLYDPAQFISFCKQQLSPHGGELVITTPYHGYLKNLLLSLLNKWDTHMPPMWLGGHIKFWSQKTLSTALTQQGFKVVAFKGCGRYPYFWKSMIIKATLD
jgi:2-polyprenyl-3-methyl-5-hydroxy-6-metoxy-1,4-benzoquinol methylase